MRLLVICTLLGALSAMGAPISYDVNRTIGGGGVTGTIVTDGTIGVLGAGNIVDWNLVLDDGSGTFNNLGPLSGNNSTVFFTATTNLTATATELLFDFSGPIGGVLFQNPFIGSGSNYWCVQVSGGVCFGGTGDGVFVSTTLQTQALTGIQVIGTTTSDVPEPTSLSLIGLGAIALGLIRKRRTLA